MPGIPVIVTLCGSTRFYEAFQRANFEETLAGRIVLSVGFYAHATPEQWAIRAHGELVGITPEQKQMLDALHKSKIDLSDEILVVSDESGYFGESTRSEITYALAHGKRVRWMHEAIEERWNALAQG